MNTIKEQIVETIKERECALSAKGIATYANMEITSENVQQIESNCWEMVEDGVLTVFDRPEMLNGLVFKFFVRL